MRNYNIHRAPGQHLTFSHREIIAAKYNKNLRRAKKNRLSQRAIARKLGIPQTTFQTEIKRGIVTHPIIYNDKEYWDYSPIKAQDVIVEGAMNKGTPMRFTRLIGELLKIKIKNEGKSPNHAREDLLREGCEYVPSLSSIYNHIDHGSFGVLHGETPYRPKKKRRKKDPVRKSLKNPENLSIEDRPDLSERDEFGHWEMDAVVSRLGGKGGLLVLIERKTRMYLILKIGSITKAAVLKAIKALIRSGKMKKVLSITTDNGGEFLDSQQIKDLFVEVNKELKIYYTHAYAAWEKGSVENANRHVRRFYPKGTDFRDTTPKQIEELEDFINSIPRTKSLKGKTANEAYSAAA